MLHLQYKVKSNKVIILILKYKSFMIDIVKYYKSLPTSRNGEKLRFREKVMARCHMSYPLFMGRIHRNNWTFLEREAIEEIIRKEMEEVNGTQVHDV